MNSKRNEKSNKGVSKFLSVDIPFGIFLMRFSCYDINVPMMDCMHIC